MKKRPMSGRSLILLGGGGHAAVVAESARTTGWSVAGYLDDDDPSPEAAAIGLARLGGIQDLAEAMATLPHHAPNRQAVAHAAIGDPVLRRRWTAAIGPAAAGPIIHATAVISPSATLDDAVFVGPGAIINARAVINRGAIVNSGAIIEHDCVLGAFCHVAPGAALGGGAAVGEETLVGINALVLPGVRIGARATLGAGAVAVTDLADGNTAVGNPARLKIAARQF